MNRTAFCTATVKRFEEELQKAYRRGDKRLIRRIIVLLATNRQKDLAGIAATWGIARQTLYMGLIILRLGASGSTAADQNHRFAQRIHCVRLD